jgi:hypothetical protein
MLDIYITEIKLILSKESEYMNKTFEPGSPGSLIIYGDAVDGYNALVKVIYDILSQIAGSIIKLEKLFIFDKYEISEIAEYTEWHSKYYDIRENVRTLFSNYSEIKVGDALNIIKSILKDINESINLINEHLPPLD